MALDINNTNQAYLCGRLFAVLERIQELSAAPVKLNRTIKDAFFASAASKPALVFPKLLSLSQNHVKKLNDGKQKYLAVQDEMNEIVDLFNQMQRRFMQSYKEIHEITQSLPDSLDDINVDFDEEDNLDGEYADEEVRFHFAGRRDADDLLDEDEDAD